MIFAEAIRAMSAAISHILFSCCPTEVVSPSVAPVAVVVRNIGASLGGWAMECFTNEPVNLDLTVNPIDDEIHTRIFVAFRPRHPRPKKAPT
jgi:hypothetical protein